MKYCSDCGNKVTYRIPEDDNRHRYVCEDCGLIHYENPKIVVGTIPIRKDGRVLLCKRAISPRSGYWTLPAGFLENGETMLEGGLRETREEAQADMDSGQLYRIYDLPYINQVYVFFYTPLDHDRYAAGKESLEVRLFTKEEIPWHEIAVPVVTAALQDYYKDRKGQNGNKFNGIEARYQALANPFAAKTKK